MLDHVDIVEVEQVVDALNVGELSAQLQVDHKVEGHHQQRVAEEPEYLEDGLPIRVSWIRKGVISFVRKSEGPVLRIVLKGSMKK